MLEGFKTVNLTAGFPYLSITSNGVTFNKATIIKLGQPSHVHLMINEERKMIAVKICDFEDANATSFYKAKKSGLISVRWNNRDFTNTISKMMNWDIESTGYRVNGDFIGEENAMVFDLNSAYPIGDETVEMRKSEM